MDRTLRATLNKAAAAILVPNCRTKLLVRLEGQRKHVTLSLPVGTHPIATLSALRISGGMAFLLYPDQWGMLTQYKKIASNHTGRDSFESAKLTTGEFNEP